jgi:hypothetical protein
VDTAYNDDYQPAAPGILFECGARVTSAHTPPTAGTGTAMTAIEVHPTNALGWRAEGWTRFSVPQEASSALQQDSEDLVQLIVTKATRDQIVACLSGGSQQTQQESRGTATGDPLLAGAGKKPILGGGGPSG